MGANLSWKIDVLPFVWRAQSTPESFHGLPTDLPFVLAVDERSGLVIQKHNADVESALDHAYQIGSVLGSNAAEDGFGREYAEDFLRYIAEDFGKTSKAASSVLEIGCGNGYLLSRLAEYYASAKGIEPGPQGQIGAIQYNLDIVQGFFPSPSIYGRFNAIVLSSVLEHVKDPVSLIYSMKDYLEPGGKIYVSVPNESPYITTGDVSTLFHEHWSYFDRDTLRHTALLAGFNFERCEESSFGGSIYATLNSSCQAKNINELELLSAMSVAAGYISSCRERCEKLRVYCESVISSGRTLGVYVPARFVNVMRVAGIPVEGVRFFDDDAGLLGTYYPGIPIPVESRADLIARPVDCVVIMSRTFGFRLAEQLREKLSPSTRVTTVSDVLAN